MWYSDWIDSIMSASQASGFFARLSNSRYSCQLQYASSSHTRYDQSINSSDPGFSHESGSLGSCAAPPAPPSSASHVGS